MSNFEFPKGWVSTELREILLNVTGGGTPSRKVPSYFNGEIPWFTVKDMKTFKPNDAEEHITELAIRDSATNLIPANTLIVATRISLGKAIRPTVACAINQDLKALIVGSGIDSNFLLYWVGANEQTIQDLGSGTTVKGIRLETLHSLKILLPPSSEQTRIVEKLEELLSDLDAGVAELKAAQKKLAQYRQSLLKAAVEGALTAEWRKKQGPLSPTPLPQRGEGLPSPLKTPLAPCGRGAGGEGESGAQLLSRILKERRARWEEKQLAKFKEQGKTPPKGWQDKYPEPVQPDTANLPALPEGWVWASLDQFFCELRSGTAETSGRQTTPYPVLKSSAVRQGKIDFQALNYLQQKQSTRAENYLAIGDVLITRLSGSVEYVGCCAVVRDVPTQGIQFPDRIFQGKLPPSFMWLGDYLAYCFQSAYVRTIIELAAKSTAGHKRISLSDLYPLPIPLPPAVEIKSIVLQLYSGIERAEAGEIAIIHSLTQAAAQRKNILKSAFSGQLVPQDPNDEPASVLLELIRAERQKQMNNRKPGQRRKKQEANL